MARSALSDLLPSAPHALCRILDAARGSLQLPIRSEIFGAQRFHEHGRMLGRTHRAARVSARAASFFPRLKENIKVLREAYQYIGEQASTGYDMSPAAEWLLDNFHTVEGQLKEIRDGLPRSYFRTLPMLLDQPLAGLPRVYGVAWAFVAHTDGAFDEELLAHFLISYQEVRELKLSEVWSLPTTLRVVLIENLRRLAERVATYKAAREAANICFDHIDTYDSDSLDQLLTLMNRRGVGRAFQTQMAQRVQDRRVAGEANGQASTQNWLRTALADLGALQTEQSSEQAQDNLSVSNAVVSLRAIGDADWSGIVARTSTLMQLMLVSNLFAAEDDATRDQTLHGIEKLARRGRLSEVAVAQALLALMQTAGEGDDVSAGAHHWLRGGGQATLNKTLGLDGKNGFAWQNASRQAALPMYLFVVLGVLSSLLWSLSSHGVQAPEHVGAIFVTMLGGLAMLFPASEAVVALVNRLVSESARPYRLPRLALLDGIPPPHRVIVVIPGMLTSAASGPDLAHRLELHYLANPEHDAQFALLTDWADAGTSRGETDLALLECAQLALKDLNRRHPRGQNDDNQAPRFVLLHRERTFSESEQCWIGWERKRGKLEQLVATLAGQASAVFIDLGTDSQLAQGVKYVVTLDSDTQLPPGRLRELVGVAAHPHNQPRLDPSGRFVASGYAILQPRIATPLPPAHLHTPYHWLFAGQCGVDPYSAASSEVYQDIFLEGTFTGKGLLHVHALHAVLSGRLPQEQILSHDLLEGAIARCAAVSDITVVEDAPFHPDVAASRAHRWTRGDWQLLPVLMSAVLDPTRYRIRAVNVWKLVDNLRRSLVAPMSLIFLSVSLAGTGVSPWTALALVYSAFSAGPLLGALAGFSLHREDVAKRHFFGMAAMDLVRAILGGAWHVAQLLQHALLAVDAIARALYRTMISHRRLLQWTTAAVAQSQAKTTLGAIVRLHWMEPWAALGLLVVLTLVSTPYPGLAIGLCLLWAGSPIWTWLSSRTRPVPADALLTGQDSDYLEGIARDTWRLFERCVGADDNHLPPDNLQLSPYDMVAHRTSPTNIGLYLLSIACARQFGWIGTADMLARLEATVSTLGALQQHRGHFLNWYDTQTCSPLLPMYVSTVDSGNLVAHMLTVAQACRELAHSPLESSASERGIRQARARVALAFASRKSLTAVQRQEVRWLIADYRAALRMAGPEQLSEAGASERLRTVAASLTQLAWGADFSFLYHRKRHLFHIGYRIAEHQRDAGFYDLLASESRLTSLLAIAKGDVPVRHWASLGRPFFAVGNGVGLRSWTGSMFEYLMPSLVLVEPVGSVLHAACEAALHEQIDFARSQRVPWGISESAYAARDHTLAFQYAPQGVPRLALRRTPPDELVVAPYATALAALILPRLAVQNFRALEGLGARGRYGFMDALDFTPTRRVSGSGHLFTNVDTVMAHHQGMTIVALANVLLHGVAQRWGMANAPVEAVASLLHERVPREVSQLHSPRPGLRRLVQQRRRAPGLLRELTPGALAIEPTHLLSNGQYSVSLRANGAGWSRWGQTGITRQRDDALRDEFGSFLFIRRAMHDPVVSLTQHPAADPNASYECVYHADRVCFGAVWPDLQAQVTVWVSPEDDIEFRMVELRNLGDEALDLELMSAFEVTLADQLADEAHPAFSNLFVRAQWLHRQQALLFERHPRVSTEGHVGLAHFVAISDERISGTRLQTDRQRWLGRNRSSRNPMASLDPLPAPLPSTQGGTPLVTGLDPICALGVQMRIAPKGRVVLTFGTAISDDPATLRAVIDKYRQPNNVRRASLMSATLASIRLRSLRISAENLSAMQTLTTAMVSSLTRQPGLRVGAVDGHDVVCDRRLLWRFGVSGDRPLVLVFVGAAQGLGLVRAMAQVLNLWSWSGVGCDLMVVNSEPNSYTMVLHNEITTLIQRHALDGSAGTHRFACGFHVVRADELSASELSTLKTQARLRLHADGRPLFHHVQEWVALHTRDLKARRDAPRAWIAESAARGLVVAAPTGVFSSNASEFVFPVSPETRPDRPWINVLSNPRFGAQISEVGSGYTWAVNSRLNQLTAWSNDPVTDPSAECYFLQDTKTREVWSVAPNAMGAPGVQYQVTHGQGYSIISHRHGDLDVRVTWCVDPHVSVKQMAISVTNHGQRTRRLRVVAVVGWMMGANRSDRNTVLTDCVTSALQDEKLTTLLAIQRERASGFGGGTAFLCASDAVQTVPDWTCDRRECFDSRGQCVLPARFGRLAGEGLDPCAAIAVTMDVRAGHAGERSFLLGYAPDAAAARQLASTAAAVSMGHRMESVRVTWQELLGATTVKTPDPLFDALVNRWLLYQTVSCRLWAKAGFYQAGGATGYRDQLQDAMALVWAAPHLLRAQIVLCASRQFEQGDVQHWWHAPLGAGVRTHFSDDLLWLAFACTHYVHATGDAAVLDERVLFLEGPPIAPGAEDAYYIPSICERDASVYEHAARAIDRSLRVGVHGLPLMGSGDWNDGMNRVGIDGRGESVWLGWFLCQLVADFLPLAHARGELARAHRWEAALQGWKHALNGTAWDGQWFKRAFFDDGQPLGSHVNPEARIDLIAQAWAVLSGVAAPTLQDQALDAIDANLVDREHGLIKLLEPPFVHAVPSAGYIQGYPPGVRENGGQYSHAGVWALMAAAARATQTGELSAHGDDPYRYFTYLSPAHRASHPTYGPAYGLEPYAMAGDVYSQPPYAGRGGWSWYTGAAAWLHRAAIESIFGLKLGADELKFQPCLPSHWQRAELTLVRAGRTMHFILVRASPVDAGHAPLAPSGQSLSPGQSLRWTYLPAQSRFVISLPAVEVS